MIIQKIMNNNAVVVQENNEEFIALGCGLGFGTKIGNKLDETKIEKKYKLSNSNTEKVESILANLPTKYISIADKILEYAKNEYNLRLPDSLLITLADHLDGAVERKNKGIEVKNKLKKEIFEYYPEPTAIAKVALDIIAKTTGIIFGDDEQAYIAMHIANSMI